MYNKRLNPKSGGWHHRRLRREGLRVQAVQLGVAGKSARRDQPRSARVSTLVQASSSSQVLEHALYVILSQVFPCCQRAHALQRGVQHPQAIPCRRVQGTIVKRVGM